MSDQANGEDEKKKLADAADKLARAAEKLGRLPDAINKTVTDGAENGNEKKTPRKKKSRWGKAVGRIKKGLGKVWKAAKKTDLGKKISRFSASKTAGGASGAAADATGAAAGGAATGAAKAIPWVAAAAAAAGALNDFRKSIQQAADSALEAHRKYVEVSGSQAAIFAEADMRQMQRDIRQGEATASSAKELAGSIDDRKEMFSKLETSVDNATNLILATGSDLLNGLLKIPVELFTGVVDTFNDFVKDFRDTFGLSKKDIDKVEFVSLAALRDKIDEDARDATRKAWAGMERAKAALARGERP